MTSFHFSIEGFIYNTTSAQWKSKTNLRAFIMSSFDSSTNSPTLTKLMKPENTIYLTEQPSTTTFSTRLFPEVNSWLPLWYFEVWISLIYLHLQFHILPHINRQKRNHDCIRLIYSSITRKISDIQKLPY